MSERITYEPAEALAHQDDAGAVDEIVLYGAAVHLEMLGHNNAYLQVGTATRWVHAVIYIRPVSWRDRRARLRADRDRLVDHLWSLLPWSSTRWSIPVWRRPAEAAQAWWEARRYAAAVLVVRVDDDIEVAA